MARHTLTFDDLLAIARRTGVTNWPGGKVVAAPSSWRGKRGAMGTVVGCVRHHTGTPETYSPAADYPTYQVVKEGRAGLENSLSAFGLGRHVGIYVFSEFLSWHAGAWSYAGITDGNGHFLGIEAEGTGAVWTPFQREFYPRLVASILDFIGEGADMMPRHADGAVPAGRKNDAANLWPSFTAEVTGYLADPRSITYGASSAPPEPTKEWWEMPIPAEEIEKIAQRTRQVLADGSLPYGLDNLRRRLEALDARVALSDASDSPEELAEAIVARLPEGVGELTGADVEAALRRVLADAAGG